METQIGTYLLTQGVLGVAVIALATVVIKLYSRNEKLNDRLIEIAQTNGKEMISFYQSDAITEGKTAEAITKMAYSIETLTAKVNKGAL